MTANKTLFIIDAFAARPFSGNQAAVCLLDQPASHQWLQDLALELNFSETAYLWPTPDSTDSDYHLRWFTPRYEVDLCGHATLASAHRLWFEDGSGVAAEKEELRFQTRSGILKARKCQDNAIQLDFPATPPAEAELPAGLLESLAPQAAEALEQQLEFRGKTPFDTFLQLSSAEAVHALKPDFVALGQIPTRGIIVTAEASSEERSRGIDFVSRFFAPTAGIHEDPVTGSAHCALAPYWTERKPEWLTKGGKEGELTGFQASERGGLVRVEVQGDRVLLRGTAHTIVGGSLSITPA